MVSNREDFLEYFSTPLEEEIKEVQVLLDKPKRTKAEDELLHSMTMRFARFLGSPSKLNAASVLSSNPAWKLAAWLTQEEG